MEDNVIYIAGNPDAYPVEYFDEQTGTYQGLIPELMDRFGAETGYDIRYYQPGSTDKRKGLANNRQVDVISGCKEGERFRHEEGQEVIALDLEGEGAGCWRLLLTEAAPESLKEELENYVSQISQETRMCILLETVAKEPAIDRRSMRFSCLGMMMVMIALVVAIVCLVRYYRRRLQRLEKSRETDEITGIGNQEYLERYYGQFINDKNKILYSLIYLYMDTMRMDRFGGRNATNVFLRHVAGKLQNQTADTDILARIADGGFILFRLSTNEEELEKWLNLLLDSIRDFPGESFPESVRRISAGVYRLRHTDYDLYEMISDTEQCALAAYRQEENIRFYTGELMQALWEERKLQADLRRGLDMREFQIYIQFCVKSTTGKVIGGEALSRWNHPERGLLVPEEFVPLMEREHLTMQMDYHALEDACAFLENLEIAGKKEFILFCNFSQETFSGWDFPRRCMEIIERYSFDRKRLIFEVVQGYGEYVQPVSQNIRRLRQNGIKIALTDNGVTSFMELQSCLPDILKLDRKLIESIGTTEGESVLRALLQICRELDIIALAKGVENDGQECFLREHSCDILQGFRFFKPVPEWEARRYLLSESGNDELAPSFKK